MNVEKYSIMIDLDNYATTLKNNPELVYPKYELRVGTWEDGTHIAFFTYVKDVNTKRYMPVKENYRVERFASISLIKKAEEDFYNKCSSIIKNAVFNEKNSVTTDY